MVLLLLRQHLRGKKKTTFDLSSQEQIFHFLPFSMNSLQRICAAAWPQVSRDPLPGFESPAECGRTSDLPFPPRSTPTSPLPDFALTSPLSHCVVCHWEEVEVRMEPGAPVVLLRNAVG